MAIALASLGRLSLTMTAAALTAVAFAITAGVYGAVALIVKLDDIGLHLAATAQRPRPPVRQCAGAGGAEAAHALYRALGTAAMLWVGGGILVHGLEELHILEFVPRTIHDLAHQAAAAGGGMGGVAEWLVTALGGAIVGLVVGAILAAIVRQFTRHPEEFVVE